MPLELRPINKLTYKLKLTPQVKLAINLLQMPLVKLKEYIKEQFEENPLLDIEKTGLPPKPKEGYEKDYNNFAANPPTLTEHLLKQLHSFTNSDDDCKIGESIIGNINDDGYLTCSIEDMAKPPESTSPKVEKLLSLIQTFDPVGVGARDLKECLLLQLKSKGGNNSLAWQIVDTYLPYLKNKRYDYIAKKLSASGGKVSVESIKETMKEIANLEPKPGRSFNAEKTIRLIPDAMLRKGKKGYEVMLNDWELPSITLNAKYKRMLKQKDTDKDAKVYLQERLGAARSLIDAVKRRKETVRKVIEEITDVQKDFFDNGKANFKPMTLGQIAKRIGKHKSTVSRAVTNKYLETPYGIVELRSFLNSGIKQENGELFSSNAIKSKIKELLEKEGKDSSLTDQQITQCLKEAGIFISRRTVAKYRTQLKILSSKSR